MKKNKKATVAAINPQRSLIIAIEECVMSNPNGDPSREGEPRIGPDGRGIISAVSRRKKFRLIMENKDGQIWEALKAKYNLDPKAFQVALSKTRDQKELAIQSDKDVDGFLNENIDVRLYGATKLFTGQQGMVTTGVIQTGMGSSIGPVPPITYGTVTVSYGVKDTQKCTMANNSIKCLPYALFKTTENIDGWLGSKTHCTTTDIEVYKSVQPYLWTANKSQGRIGMRPVHMHCITWKNPLDQRFDYEIEAALTPTLKKGVTVGTSREDFNIPTWDDIKKKFTNHVDYVDLAQVTL